jgi:FlaA1/EpsC-like NDP-sugar epimerase
MPLEKGVEMVFWALQNALGGEILVPKIPSYRICDLAQAVGPNCRQDIIGIRPGEKLHEEMITNSDSINTIEFSEYYAILGTSMQENLKDYKKIFNARLVPSGFSYESGNNPEFLSVEQIRSLIKTLINPEFSPY